MPNNKTISLLFGMTLALLCACALSAQDADVTFDGSPQAPEIHGRVGATVYAYAAEVGGAAVRRWVLIGRPNGSHASLENPTSSTLIFVPDLSGLYVAQAITPGVPSPLLEIAVGPSRTLVPVETRVSGACGAFAAARHAAEGGFFHC